MGSRVLTLPGPPGHCRSQALSAHRKNAHTHTDGVGGLFPHGRAGHCPGLQVTFQQGQRPDGPSEATAGNVVCFCRVSPSSGITEGGGGKAVMVLCLPRFTDSPATVAAPHTGKQKHRVPSSDV